MSTQTPVILPVDRGGDSRTSSIDGLTHAQIVERIGFPANVQDDESKVKYSWGFTVDGERCGVWDYKGSHEFNSWSAFGPRAALNKVFGDFLT